MNLRVRAGAVALIVILSICALVRFSRKPSNTAHAPTRGLPAPLGLPTTGRPAHP